MQHASDHHATLFDGMDSDLWGLLRALCPDTWPCELSARHMLHICELPKLAYTPALNYAAE